MPPAFRRRPLRTVYYFSFSVRLAIVCLVVLLTRLSYGVLTNNLRVNRSIDFRLFVEKYNPKSRFGRDTLKYPRRYLFRSTGFYEAESSPGYLGTRFSKTVQYKL